MIGRQIDKKIGGKTWADGERYNERKKKLYRITEMKSIK